MAGVCPQQRWYLLAHAVGELAFETDDPPAAIAAFVDTLQGALGDVLAEALAANDSLELF